MRFGIFSDCHLGVSRFRKISNFQNAYCNLNNRIFEEALDILNSHKLDGIIIAGDLFDSPNPNVQSIIVANRLSNIKIPIFALGGNHDFSQRDAAVGYHPFDLLLSDNINSIYDSPKTFNFNDCDITMIPYKFLNEETYRKIYNGKLRDKQKHSILVIHGSVDLNNDMDSQEYSLPKEVASNYNLVIAGHVHIPQIIKTSSTSILVPGSLMPSAQATSNMSRPSVYIYDTFDGSIKPIELKLSPKIHDIVTSDINEVLESISNQEFNNDLYFIKYNGKIADVDEYLYKKASQNTLNLSIQTNEQIDNVNVEKISDFWTFINESYPKYYDEFKEFLKGE